MPWHEVSIVEQRLEFVRLAQQQGVSLAELCRRFDISRVTGYKWLERAGSGEAMADRSRRPQSSAVGRESEAHPAFRNDGMRFRFRL